MTGRTRPALPLTHDGQLRRLAAFRKAHPRVPVEPIRGPLVWQARIPEEDGETVLTDYALGDLLDRLDMLPLPGTAR